MSSSDSPYRLPLRIARALAAIVFGVVVGLVVAEAVVRIGDFDWRFARRLLRYNEAFLSNHMPDPDPVLRYRHRPNSQAESQQSEGKPSIFVTINSLGFRSPERPAAKPPGVFRVVCAGGSNVFGFGVDDSESWPARLEAELRARTGREIEVWNAGTNAYVGAQMAIVLGEAVQKIDPDLAIIALTNVEQPPFLLGVPVEPYFDKDPELWLETIPRRYFEHPAWLSEKSKVWLVAHLRVYRFVLLAMMEWTGIAGEHVDSTHEERNVRMIREFVEHEKDRRRVVFFHCPAERERRDNMFRRYTEDLGVPLFVLDADGKPPSWAGIHPPPAALAWYADALATWLIDRGLVPAGPPAE